MSRVMMLTYHDYAVTNISVSVRTRLSVGAVPRKCQGRLIHVTPCPNHQPSSGTGGQANGEPRCVQVNSLVADFNANALVFGVRATLHDHIARFNLVHVDQRDGHTIVRQPVHEGRDIFRYSSASHLRIEISQPAVQRSGTASWIESCQHQLAQRSDRGGVELHGIIGEPRVRRCRVGSHTGDSPADRFKIPPQGLFRIAGIVTRQESDPLIASHATAVTFLARPEPAVKRSLGPRRFAKVVPAVIAVHARIHVPVANHLCIGIDQVDHFRPSINIAAVAGQQERVSESN